MGYNEHMTSYINTIIENLSVSLQPVQRLISGFGYITGILFFIVALMKFYQISNARASGSSGIGIYVPLAYLIGGASIIYITSTISVMTNTLFGMDSVLQYTQPAPANLTKAVILIIKTIGLIWFVRGCILMTTASEPGSEHGIRGLIFVTAGTLSINFEAFTSMLNSLFDQLAALSINVKQILGF